MKRLFLLGLLLLALCAPTARCAPTTFGDATQARAAQAARDSVGAITRSLESDYRISIFADYVPRASWNLTGEAASDDDLGALAVFVAILNDELRKYPRAFVHNTHLGAIVLVKDLAIDGQRRGAVPDYIRQVLWLDFKNYTDRPAYQRHIIHHEFYHMIEFERQGDAYFKDPQWSGFNAPDFRYGNGGVTAYSSKEKKPWADLTHPQSGFITWYSMLGLEEDKAEIFAALWMKDEREKMEEWAQTDPILRAKIDYLKANLREIDPKINDDFWRAAGADKPSVTSAN